MVVTEKRCAKCDTIKGADQFSKRSASPDGLQYHCRACSRALFAEYSPKRPAQDHSKYTRGPRTPEQLERRRARDRELKRVLRFDEAYRAQQRQCMAAAYRRFKDAFVGPPRAPSRRPEIQGPRWPAGRYRPFFNEAGELVTKRYVQPPKPPKAPKAPKPPKLLEVAKLPKPAKAASVITPKTAARPPSKGQLRADLRAFRESFVGPPRPTQTQLKARAVAERKAQRLAAKAIRLAERQREAARLKRAKTIFRKSWMGPPKPAYFMRREALRVAHEEKRIARAQAAAAEAQATIERMEQSFASSIASLEALFL